MAILAADTSFGQTSWEMTPYKIDILVAIEQQPEISGQTASDLLTGLAQRIDAVVGPMWKVSVRRAEPELRWRMLQSLDHLTGNVTTGDITTGSIITPEQLSLDKVLLVSIRTAPDRFVVEARDFDCRTHRWSSTQTVPVRQRIALVDSMFRILCKAFAPIAKIQSDAELGLVLNARASGIPPSDPELAWLRTGDVVIPILRRNDRDGNPKKNGIQEVPWTFLVVDDVSTPGKITCQVHSGTRNPLNIRRRGRIEQLALVVNPSESPTRLLLRSRTEPLVALTGYEIYTSKPGEKKTRFVGLTERDGGIWLAPDDQPLHVLFVKNGGQLLARLPVVPGLTAGTVAPIPDDGPRLQVEGDLKGLRTSMVDLVARREILMARIRRKLKEGNLADAEKTFDQLVQLPTRKPFTQQVDQLKTSSDSKDPRVQAQIDRMFIDTRNLLAKFLDPRQISDLRTEIIQAKRGL